MAAKLRIESDTTALQRDYDRLLKENAKQREALYDLGKAGAEVAKGIGLSMRQLKSFADQTSRSLATPAQAYRQELEKLRAAKQAGLLTESQYQQAKEKTKQRIREGTEAYKQQRAEQERLKRVATQAAAEMVTAADRQRAKLKDLADAHKAGYMSAEQHAAAVDRLNAEMDETTNAGGKQAGMMGTLTGKLVALGAGYMSFQAILGQVKAALAYVNQETEKAISSADQMTDPNKRLAQVATSAEDLDMMVQRADELAQRFGEDRDIVRRVSFSARSEGFEEILPQLIQYGDVVAPEAAAGVAGQVPGLFGEGSIDPLAAVNATLVAAEQSRLSFEDIARALPKIAEGGALQGADPAEAMGVLSIMAGHFASGDTAADRFKALSTRLSLNERTKGKGILGGVEALQAMEPSDRADFLGDSQELNVAYELLSRRMPDVKDRIAMIDAEIQAGDTGETTALARKYRQTYDTSTETGRLNEAMEGRRRAQIEEEIANERQFAIFGADREAAISREKKRQKEEGYVGLAQFGGHMAGQAAVGMGLEDSTAARMTRAGSDAIGGRSFSGFLGRRALGASTLGMSDLWAMAQGAMATPEGGNQDGTNEALQRIASARNIQQMSNTPEDTMRGLYEQAETEDRLNEFRATPIGAQIARAVEESDAIREEMRQLRAQANEMQSGEALQRIASASESTRDHLANRPVVGTTAAAAGSVAGAQREGR
jgi:hypothetical protein